jgi:hypothetical protein
MQRVATFTGGTMKKTSKRLALNKQVIRKLTDRDGAEVIGGVPTGPTTNAAPCSAAGSGCGPGGGGSYTCDC